jgi:hypothetical protein
LAILLVSADEADVNTEKSITTTWQGWLEHFRHAASTEGWLEFMGSGEEMDAPLWQLAALFPVAAQSSLVNSLLLAVLQEPATEAAEVIEEIRKTARSIRFGKLPRGVKREVKGLYNDSSKMALRLMPQAADGLSSVFKHYLDGQYDLAVDANVAMREAGLAATMQQRERTLDLVGRAGAAMLRGQPLWAGWADEGPGEVSSWALVLSMVRENFAGFGILPLAAVEDERSRAAERAQQLLGPIEKPVFDAISIDALDPEDLNEEFVEEWFELMNREEPLSDIEIEQLGARRQKYISAAQHVLEAGAELPETAAIESLTEFAVATLGLLRATDENSLSILMRVVKDQGDEFTDEVVDNALWSLEQIGQAALPDVFDCVRYTNDMEVRSDLLPVLGHLGQGSPDVYAYLAQQFADSNWDDGKASCAFALASLHDARAVAPIVESLGDQAATEDDVMELLDALEELGVKFTVNQNKHTVTVTGYGVIADVATPDWISRAEREAPAESYDKQERPPGAFDNTDNLDDLEVVYDASGIARCPDCGAVLHRVEGRWEHPLIDEPFVPSQRPIRRQEIGRNDPCPCGSGKKYKHCHGRAGATALN